MTTFQCKLCLIVITAKLYSMCGVQNPFSFFTSFRGTTTCFLLWTSNKPTLIYLITQKPVSLLSFALKGCLAVWTATVYQPLLSHGGLMITRNDGTPHWNYQLKKKSLLSLDGKQSFSTLLWWMEGKAKCLCCPVILQCFALDHFSLSSFSAFYFFFFFACRWWHTSGFFFLLLTFLVFTFQHGSQINL